MYVYMSKWPQWSRHDENGYLWCSIVYRKITGVLPSHSTGILCMYRLGKGLAISLQARCKKNPDLS